MPASNLTYTANAVRDSYSISYNLDGGSAIPANPTSYTSDTATFILNNPTKTGYDFAGWTGTGLSGATKTVTIAKGSTGDRTYTATWTALDYTLTFNYNGGKDNNGSTANKEYEATYGSSNYYDVSWLNPSRDGYKFEGWYTAAQGGTKVYGTNGICVAGSYWNSSNQWIGTDDLTLYAHWTEQYRYVLKFDANGGGNAPGTITADWKDASSHTFTWTTVPTRSGYDFLGWAETKDSKVNVAGNSKNSYTLTGTATQTVEKTLYAIWERQTGNLTLDHEGSNPAVVTVTGEGLNITLVLSDDMTVPDLPTGTYTVTASGTVASTTAAVDKTAPIISDGATTTVKITVSGKSVSWFTGFARKINTYGG